MTAAAVSHPAVEPIGMPPHGGDRRAWPDVVRTTAILLVVALHSFGHWLYSYGKISAPAWEFFNWVDSSTRISVPLFFMLSGALLLGREKDSSFLWRRAARILPPLLFFSLVALVFTATLDRSNYVPPWRWIVAPAYYHLWFFYTISVLYVIFALLRPSAIHPRVGLTISFLAALVLGGAVERWRTTAFTGHELTFAYLLYGFGGYFAGKCRFGRIEAWVAVAVVVACAASIAIQTSIASARANTFDESYYGYVGLPVVIGAFAAFIALRTFGEGLGRNGPGHLSGAVRLVARYAMGIYGLHAFVLQFCFLRMPGWANRYAVLASLVIFSITLIGSFGLSLLLARVDRGWIVRT